MNMELMEKVAQWLEAGAALATKSTLALTKTKSAINVEKDTRRKRRAYFYSKKFTRQRTEKRETSTQESTSRKIKKNEEPTHANIKQKLGLRSNERHRRPRDGPLN